MNIANKITVSRVILIPIFLIFFLIPWSFGNITIWHAVIPVQDFIAAIIFIVASCTDWLDGYYARKLNLVTNFGKFLDPLADKLLVMSAFVPLVGFDVIPSWMVIVILAREFAVTGLRLVAVEGGEVIAASQMAKWKTATQMIALILLLFHNIPFGEEGFPLADIFLWIAVVLTILSGGEYFYKNRDILLKSK
ncbi:CDP-diacylglycerol--glycerol-3-phosphate 3-phosphatidyltransferase [Pullulanibacillus pueri]|uniref:CDP-diacylglycerol--glycerol-3-phosphate 3-phosphatidyltransferase n=1 Tax=Pullulanibacillus pueri TaxID=1437324 RepID=A0A8J2ZW46_9BACL|nr:CDP-diacylglycerol--glycerol-3-phosphate 3-phosphatidyltransferase [Pullulanibacillus pueri]MBM7682543.1 CDP-diacylglycerol--glycerol-3-phosphate 3-phosphatidyltransferase [Pullulanibacillus pueri]GGH81985.1 CDP-diacylglycerol--glycerol-3-phosphate 3-phosphatidyltransferase [Pullulanibacillus pueri]